MTPTLTTPDPAVFPADVRTFAAERGVTEYLAPLHELAQRCFPGAEVGVRLNFDGEIADLGWIVYEVAAGQWDHERRRAGRSRFTQEKVRILPPSACEAFAL